MIPSLARIPGIILLINLALLFHCNLHAQNSEATVPVVKISGLVKTDVFFDTRQTISAREGHFLLFPSARINDTDGNDINAKASYNFLPVQSNLSASVTGTPVLGAETSALIEGDFFGGSNADVNMLRLRHAYIKLKWPKSELLIGQYWHPGFATSCYPGTVSFNTGSPIQPFSRAPQIRITYIPGKIRLMATLLSQRDYASVGPDGNSSKYLRDANIPEMQISGELNVKNHNEFILGACFGYKQIVPQIKTGMGYKTSEKVEGITLSGYLKHVSNYLTFKFEGNYLENGSEFLTLSGYVVKDTLDADKGLVRYATLKTVSFWGEVHSNGKKLQLGIFSGYTENLGSGCKVKGPYYLTSGLPVKKLYRIAPRVIYKPGVVSFACEIEHTIAHYGTPDTSGEIPDAYKVSNTRFLFSVLYKF